MANICILTDSTAQFPNPMFPGANLAYFIEPKIQLDDTIYNKDKNLPLTDFPEKLTDKNTLTFIPPTEEDFSKMFIQLSRRYDEIICILHASSLSETFNNAKKAKTSLEGSIQIRLIDSKTISAGLGLLVQKLGSAIEEGLSGEELEFRMRALIKKTYTIFYLEGLTYLENIGYLSPAQAFVGEYLKLQQVFIFEDGQLVPLQKMRNYRHLQDVFQEFADEFPELEHIAILQGTSSVAKGTRSLRARLTEEFPHTTISKHSTSSIMTTFFGPKTLGMFLIQP
ncbi:MAG: DegV family EDD domain-containing protein [Anaerolineales bacterium]|nr:DegV family EDD domain-containing protein [Anaerolineales bacterium]